MNVRLSIEDQSYVRAIQEHFAGIEPLGVVLGPTDVVRLGLRTALSKAGIHPGAVSDARLEVLAETARREEAA